MRILRIIKISRPVSWVIGPIIFSVPFFIFKTFPSPVAFMQMLSLSFPLCFILFGINDIFDYESDRKNPRKGSVHGAVLRKSEFRIVWLLSFIFALTIFILSLTTFNSANIILSALLLFFSYFYSSKPIRLKELPPLDSISNALIIYLLVGIGYSYIEPVLILPFNGFIRDGYTLLLAVVSIHIFSTLMDYTPDKKVNVRTFSTVFGKRNASLSAILIMVIALISLESRDLFILGFLFSSLLFYAIIFAFENEKLARKLFCLQFIIFFICSTGYLLTRVF